MFRFQLLVFRSVLLDMWDTFQVALNVSLVVGLLQITPKKLSGHEPPNLLALKNLETS